MTCTATLGDSEGLACMRTDDHAAGHIFHSTSGVPDAHTESSHE